MPQAPLLMIVTRTVDWRDMLDAYRVVGAEALEDSLSPDVIIVDDLEDCRVLHTQREDTPILMLLASDEASMVEAALSAGAADFLTQPLRAVTFQHRVSQLMRLRSADLVDGSQEANLLRTVVDNLPDYIFAKDAEGRFILTNRANADYLGLASPDEAVGKTDFDFYAPARAESFRADDMVVMEHGRPMLNHEISVYYEDLESTRWYAVTKVPLRAETDEITGVVGLVRDVTERHAAEEQMRLANQRLQELNDLKSHFLHNISHELRTPLNIILGNADMLLQEMLGPLNDTQKDRLLRLQRNGQDLLNIIEDVLAISRFQSGKMKLLLDSVDLESTLAECVPEFEEEANAKGLRFVKDIEPNLPPIYGERESILKVMTNLVSNAVKFTKQGSIVVHAQRIPASVAETLPIELNEQRDTWVMISVQDTGIGISAEMQNRIFDEFRQVDGSSTRQHGGTGLGLAVCHKLVSFMQGYLWLESVPSFGSTFFVLLPTTT